jgi:toxin ParE1/3/4
MLDVQLSAAADQDLKDIWRGISEYRLERADQKIDQIVQKFELLSQYPLAGRQRDDILSTLRSFPVDRRLLILYQIRQDRDREIVEIVRVIDGRRNLKRLFNPEEPDEANN